jgi:hypothetical protein
MSADVAGPDGSALSEGLGAGAGARCWCHTCRPMGSGWSGDLSDIRMVLCPECGNKRCPKAMHHDHYCTRSNASGQLGSAYGSDLCQQCVTPKVCTRNQRCLTARA